MRLRLTILAGAALLAASTLSSPAEARGFGFHGGFGHVGGWGHGGWGHGGWGHGGWGWGGVGLGLATGALVGAALAAPYYDHYDYPYSYGYGYPVGYDYEYYSYAPPVAVGYVGPYWGHRRWAHRHYGYGVRYGRYRSAVAFGVHRPAFSHAAYRAYGRARFIGVGHRGRFR
jgi:hypothetical protein